MIELLSCPFCGSDSAMVGYHGQPAVAWTVGCLHCGADGGRAEDMAGAIAAWNRRTPQPVTPAGGEVDTLQRARLLALHRGLELARKWSCDGAAGDTGTHFADSLIRRMGEQMRVALSSQDGDYTHPPVADAALVQDAERYRFLRNDALYYAYASSGLKPMPWCAIGMDKRNFRLAEKEDLDAAIDAALNQRGGDSNG